MKLFFIVIFLTILGAQAQVISMPVNLRNAKMKLEPKDIDAQSNLAESKHFKIMLRTENEVVDFSNENLTNDERLRAGTALYHLKIARDYFVNVLGSEYVANLPQMNVRLDMTKPFNEFFHFIGDSKIDQYNNAVTIPASNIKARKDVAPWNVEIWFRPPQKEEINNKVYQAAKQLDSAEFAGGVAGTLADQGIRDAVTQKALYDTAVSIDYMSYATNLLAIIGIFEVAPKVMMFVSKPFKTTTYLDTAMIPEVVYHEFTHAALSDFISLRRSTPLNEGFANYFAAVINGYAKVGSKVGRHSKNISPFDGDQKLMYDSRFETIKASHSNFVFSFLWGMRDRFAKEMEGGELLADKMIFASRKHVNFAENSIKDDLIQALTNAADDVFPKSQGRKIRFLINSEARARGI